jgi:hypothetical protein
MKLANGKTVWEMLSHQQGKSWTNYLSYAGLWLGKIICFYGGYRWVAPPDSA